jgi:DNA polymerase I-like protein with 3'-5' exonuclease and polymerase domains
MATIPKLMQNHIDVVTRKGKGYDEYFDFDPSLTDLPIVAFDVETPSIGGPLWHWNCDITAWSIYTDDSDFVDRVVDLTSSVSLITKTSNGLVFRWNEAQRSALQYVLDNCVLIMHNSSFDLQRVACMGFSVPKPGRYQDTMIMAYVLGYRDLYDSISLETLARFVGKTKVKATNEDFDNVTDEVLARCLSDTEITHLLYERFSKELDQDLRVKNHYQYVDLPFSLIVREMQETGLYIDRPKLEKITQESLEERDNTLLEIMMLRPYGPKKVQVSSTAIDTDEPLFCLLPGKEPYDLSEPNKFKSVVFVNGELKKKKDGSLASSTKSIKFVVASRVDFNPNSDAHIRDVLRESGWVPNDSHELTDGGLVKVGGNELKTIVNEVDDVDTKRLINLLRQYKKVQKLLSTYLEKYNELLAGNDRIRCNFNQCLTRTGRLSSSRPNLQNIPARGPMGKLLRSMFVAPTGMVMTIGDDSQIEARILADALSRHFGDSRLADAFIANIDIHLANAFDWGLVSIVCSDGDPEELRRLYDEGIIDKDDALLKLARDLEKTTLYGAIYGASKRKLGNGNMELGERIVQAMSIGAPGIDRFKNAIVQSCLKRRNSAVYNIFGRRALYPAIRAVNDRRAVSRAKRQVVNSVIQSSSFSRCATKAIQAYPKVKQGGGSFASMAHDEFMIYAPAKTVRWVTKQATIIFSHIDSLEGCPVRFKFSVVRNWSQK